MLSIFCLLRNSSDLYYAEIRNTLEKQGQPIGANDLLIAAHALSLNLTVVTARLGRFKDFCRRRN